MSDTLFLFLNFILTVITIAVVVRAVQKHAGAQTRFFRAVGA